MKIRFYLLIFNLLSAYFSIAQSPVAHYPMNKTSEDVTGNHDHLKKPNCRFEYDGLHTKGIYSGGKDNGNFISTAPLYKLNLNKFSISLQFEADQKSKMPVFILGRSCRMLGVYVTEDGYFSLYANNGDIMKKTTVMYVPNKWYHTVVTYDQITKQATLYIDGKQATIATVTFESSCLSQWKYSNLDISTNDYSNGKMFKGTWKQLKVYNSNFVPDGHKDNYEDLTTSITISWVKPTTNISSTRSHYPIEVKLKSNSNFSGIKIYRNNELVKSYSGSQFPNKRSVIIKNMVLLHKGKNKIEVHAFAGNKDIKSSQEINYHVSHNVTSNSINNNLSTTSFQYNGIKPFNKTKYVTYSPIITPTKDNGSYLGWKDQNETVHISKLNSSGKVTKDFTLGKSRRLYAIHADETGFVALLVHPKKGIKQNMEWAYLVKYNLNGTKVFDQKLFGDNSFANEGNRGFDDWSTTRIAYTGNYYYVVCGVSRKWADGVVHQGDLLFIIDKQGKKVEKRPSTVSGKYVNTNGWSWGSSHSFQQRIVTDGDYVYVIAKGDAYPRGIAYTRVLENLEITNPITKGGNLFKMSGPTGQNYVPMTLGDIEVAGNNSCVVSFAAKEKRSSYDVGFIFVNKEGKPTVKWLTNTSHIDESHVYMTTYGDHFLVAWMALHLSKSHPEKEKPKYMAAVVDADGNFVLKPFEINSQFQSRRIVHESKWSKYNNAFSNYNYITNDFITYPNGDIGWVYTDYDSGELKIVRIKK